MHTQHETRPANRDAYLAVVGTYSSADTEGVYTVSVDADTGEMRVLDGTVVGRNPTFIVPHPTGEHLYVAVREEDRGVLKAFDVDQETGELDEHDRVQSGPLGPCYCSVDANGEYLFVAHYFGSAVSMLPIDKDGGLGEPTALVEHQGSSVHPDRQTEPHPHSVVLGPDDRFVYVPDLGTDQIHVYEIDGANDALSPHAVIDTPAGAGPRHFAFGPGGERGYLITELDSTVIQYTRRDDGTLDQQSSVSTLPDDFEEENVTAEVAVHPSGEFVYGSNRGHDSIVTFTVADGALARVDHTPTGGEWPRHFAVGPGGRFVFAENRESDTITALRIDEDTGLLSPTGEELSVPEPVCMQWLPR